MLSRMYEMNSDESALRKHRAPVGILFEAARSLARRLLRVSQNQVCQSRVSPRRLGCGDWRRKR